MPTVSLASAKAICSALQLGEILGVTERRVRQLTTDGVLKCTRTKLSAMHYQLADSVQRFLKYRCDLVTEQCAAGNGEYEQARTRRMKAAASMAELELQAKQGFYLRCDDVEFHLTLLLRNMRDRILAIPSRTMHQLVGRTSAMECNQIVRTEIDVALNEIADRKCFDWARMQKEQTAYLREQGFPEDVIAEM
jgi:phage terminase Nu1 subunit (DNA packaging protein)